MKTPEELNALKNEVESLNKKLADLTEEELKAVAGGHFSCNGCPRASGCIMDPSRCEFFIDL